MDLATVVVVVAVVVAVVACSWWSGTSSLPEGSPARESCQHPDNQGVSIPGNVLGAIL
jgi:hypothetical protein